MKKWIYTALFATFFQGMFAQSSTWQSIISEKMPDDLPLSSDLYQMCKLASIDRAEFDQRLAGSRHFEVKDGKFLVRILTRNGSIIIEDELANNPELDIVDIWRYQALAYMKHEDIIEFTQKNRDRYLVENADFGSITNEGPGVMNSTSYNADMNAGAGLKIAIVDLEFQGLNASQNSGDSPASVIAPYGTIDTTNGSSNHGTLCLETIFDHAPAATYYIFDSGNGADLGTIVDYCIDNGIDILSYSVSNFNSGWSDDEGPACDAMNEAAENNILVFVSAGNYANQKHYQSHWNDPNNNDWHNFPNGLESNTMVVDSGSLLKISLQFNASPDPIADDYDLYLYDAEDNSLLASSTNCCSFETISWTNELSDSIGDPITVYWSVKNDGTDENEFEVFSRGLESFNFASNSGSTTSPSNSTHPNVISVGAIHYLNYQDSIGLSGIITNYSSLGPSNNNMTLPDISGPTSTSTSFGGFPGTSCSTPNAAGMAAAFWSKNMYLNANGVRQVLFRLADMYADYGSPGKDNIYGIGGFYLHDYIPNTRYILANSGNTEPNSQQPYISPQQADSYSPAGVNMIFLDGAYSSNQSVLLDKQMIYKVVKNTTVVE